MYFYNGKCIQCHSDMQLLSLDWGKSCKKLQECTWFSAGGKGDSSLRVFPACSLLGWRVIIILRARGCGHLSACFPHMCSNCVWSSK